jgi:hypothetical protein
MHDEDLVERVAALENIEAIKRLKARYAILCDTGYDPDALAALFTEDGVWDGGETWGRYEGRLSLWAFFDRASSMLPFAMHYMINPLIEISGNEATGQWHLFQATTYAATNDAVWGAGRYFEEYVKDDAGWKFRTIRLESMFWTPFDSGWVRKPFVQD